MKIGVIRGQKQSDKRKSAGVSTLLCANWLKNCVCKVSFLLSSYSVSELSYQISLLLSQYFCNSEAVTDPKIPDFAKILSLDNLFCLIGHIQES